MKFNIYKQKIYNGQIVDELVATAFSENDAKTIVKGIRAEQKNQLAYYKEVK